MAAGLLSLTFLLADSLVVHKNATDDAHRKTQIQHKNEQTGIAKKWMNAAIVPDSCLEVCDHIMHWVNEHTAKKIERLKQLFLTVQFIRANTKHLTNTEQTYFL